MISEELLKELDLEDGEEMAYFDQFAALMETSMDIGYDTFAEVMMLADREAMPEMISSFFEDIIRGVPDDNMALYSSLESRRDVLESLSAHMAGRGRGFLTDELYNFREWFRDPESVLCTPETPGIVRRLSPCEALMLFREEKLAGTKYDYDYSGAVLPEIDEYVFSVLEELEDEYPDRFRDEDGLEELPDELPADFDPTSYIPGETDWSDLTGGFDPYRDGFIDRENPVIDSFDYEQN